MSLSATALVRVARNVDNLILAQQFYSDALGFSPLAAARQDPALAEILGTRHVTVLRMQLGEQEIELSQSDPLGAPYPISSAANNLIFQHIAIVTPDIGASYARLSGNGASPISRHGPQPLPVTSGGVTAFKFRDPFGHPLELLEFREQNGQPNRVSGYDHSAVSITDVTQSIAFYETMGLTLSSQQLNQGSEQNALDGLDDVRVDVIALHSPQSTPHLELLHYRHPAPRPAIPSSPNDIAADRLVFTTGKNFLELHRDPDGHIILFDDRG